MKTFLSIVFLTVAASLFSQNTKIDSLQQRLNHAKGTERIMVLNDLAYAYGYVDFNKSITLAKEALRLAEMQKYNKAKALTYDILGRAYFISGNNKVAEEYYDKCISTAKKYGTEDDIYKALRHKTILMGTTSKHDQRGKLKDSVEAIRIFKDFLQLTITKKNYIDFRESLKFFTIVFYSSAKYNTVLKEELKDLKKFSKNDDELLSVIYSTEGFLDRLYLDNFRAIDNYITALKLSKNVSNKIEYLERIGVYFFEIKKYKEAEYFLKQALKLSENLRYKDNLSIFMYFLLNEDLGANYIQLGEYQKALKHLLIAAKYDNFCLRDRGVVYGNIGSAYQRLDSLQKAEIYYSKADAIFEKLNNKNDILGLLNSKAELLKKQHKNTEYTRIINQIEQTVEDNFEFYILFDTYQTLSEYYEQIGNYKKANENIKKWIVINDSINNEKFAYKLKEFEYKYETKEKEQQIYAQQNIIKQKDRAVILSIIAGSLIFTALIVIFILYRVRNKAYKQLVYQSLENTSNAQLLKIEDDTEDEDTIEIKNGNSQLDESLKTQIEISLNKQLAAKVYLEPNLILKTLAEKCDTNRSYLSQFINERYNMNFNTFINTLRINEAKQIISNKDNNIPLKELYLRLGFKTYSVFNEAFKKHVGVTPNFYQKTIKDLFDTSNSN